MAEKDVLDKLNEMHSDILLTRAELKETRHDVEDHHKTLYGNGREGLKIRVDRIETSHSTAKKLWILLTSGLATFIAWIEMNCD